MTCQTAGGEILGIPGRIPRDGKVYLHNQRMGKVVVTAPDRILADFVYYLALWPTFNRELFVTASGTKILHTSPGRIQAFEFNLPPLEEQRQIVGTLRALDDKIEVNQRMNTTLEAMARALFQSWFVDFDPVRAKMDGRRPTGFEPDGAALIPSSLVPSHLGPIPQGWKISALAENIEILSGGTPQTSKASYWDGDIPWYSVKDAPAASDVWVVWTDKGITQAGVDHSAAQILPERTTIISARGTVGKIALVGQPMAMNQSCYGIRGTCGYSEFFTYFLLREASEQLQQRSHGTVFDTITRQTFASLDCVFPPPALAEAFDRTVTPWLERIKANLRESRTLAALRDTLLPKLLSGEIRVKS
jgi:type I restriction enzyme S subunit